MFAIADMSQPSRLNVVLDSALASCLAGLTVGLSESAPVAFEPGQALAGAGYLCALLVPIGLVISAVLRFLWRAWRPGELAASMTEEGGGAPRLAAWAVFLFAGAAALAATSFHGVSLVTSATASRAVLALSMPMLVVLTAAVLAALSRPAVALIAAGLRRLDRALSDPGHTRLSPTVVVASTLAVCAAALALAWFLLVRPQIGHLNITFILVLTLWGVLLLALPPILGLVLRSRVAHRAAISVSVAITVASVATAMWLRHARPYAMLELWGDARLTGYAIDLLYDVQELRPDLDIEGIEPVERPGADHPDIVLITVDTVRADRTPMHGGSAAMPSLEDLGRKGVIFERAYSSGNVTRRTLPAVATGLSPPRIRGQVRGWALKMDPRHVMVSERFSAAGYQTVGFFCCSSQFGREHQLGLIRGLDQVNIQYKGNRLSQDAAEWLAERSVRGDQRPLFLWAHYIEPHGWEKAYPAAEHKTLNRRQRYDKSLEATDRHVGVLIAAIRANLGEDAIIVVTSDHGEGLGDHRVKNHSMTLYDSEIRVPLLVSGGGIAPRRIREVVSTTDLAPTLLDLAGYQPPGMPAMDGLSLAPLLRGEEPDELGSGEAYSVMMADRSVEETHFAIMSGRYKMIVHGDGEKHELYDLVSDPAEKRNLRLQLPKVLDSFKARLARRHAIDDVPAF